MLWQPWGCKPGSLSTASDLSSLLKLPVTAQIEESAEPNVMLVASFWGFWSELSLCQRLAKGCGVFLVKQQSQNCIFFIWKILVRFSTIFPQKSLSKISNETWVKGEIFSYNVFRLLCQRTCPGKFTMQKLRRSVLSYHEANPIKTINAVEKMSRISSNKSTERAVTSVLVKYSYLEQNIWRWKSQGDVSGRLPSEWSISTKMDHSLAGLSVWSWNEGLSPFLPPLFLWKLALRWVVFCSFPLRDN